MSSARGSRVLAIWLPRLPLDRLVRAGQPGAEGLFAVTREERSAVRLAVLSREALAAGLTPGMTLADARAVASDLLTVPEDPGRDAQLLASIQRFCERYTPASARDGADGLLLDLTGTERLFGGEAQVVHRIRANLSRLGLTPRLALADTRGAARALARWGTSADEPVRIAAVGGVREALADLPAEAVAEPRDAATLRRLGLRCVGDLYPVATAQLARRFGLGFTERLDRTLGRVPDPVTPERTLPSFSARLSLPDPIGLEADVAEGVRRLTEQVCRRLAEASYGARQLRLEIARADRTSETLTVGLAWPSRDAKLILGQLRPRLGKLDARTGIDALRLAATVVEPHTEAQHGLAREAAVSGDLSSLVASLGNRIGFDRVRAFGPSDSHLPERGFALVAPHELPDTEQAEGGRTDPSQRDAPPRPLQAVPLERAEVTEPGRPPGGFVWRGRSFSALYAEGPERILPEWWREDEDWSGGPRDYWRVQTKEGERLWLATMPAARRADWYVAGVFA